MVDIVASEHAPWCNVLVTAVQLGAMMCIEVVDIE